MALPDELKPLIGDFEAYLSAALPPPETSELIAAVRYSCCEHGGKRLRPLMVLSSCLDLGGRAAAAYPAAAAVELIHCYSLIHDDLPALDNDDYRRGAPSCHKRFGEASAILTGDLLQSLALRLLCQRASPDTRLALINSLLAATEAMVYGQQLDMSLRLETAQLEQVRQMHLQKSAALIACALEMGAICAGASTEQRQRLHNIGLQLGLAFQIQDDLQDLGAEKHKCTWPALSSPQAAQAEMQRLYQSCQEQLSSNGASQNLLKLLPLIRNRSN